MGALSTIMEEMYNVRREVFRRQARDATKIAVYYGRLAEMELKRDPEIMMHLNYRNDKPSMFPQTLMGALLQADYGLPEYAVAIHVDGKPYHTFSLAPPPEPSE